MTKETKDKIINLSKIIGAILVIQGALMPIALPFLDSYIDSRIYDNLHTPQFKHESKTLIDEYLESAEFKLFILGFETDLEEKFDKRYSRLLK